MKTYGNSGAGSYCSPACKVLEITPYTVFCGSLSGRQPINPFSPIDPLDEE